MVLPRRKGWRKLDPAQETEVLRMLADGKRVREICSRFGISHMLVYKTRERRLPEYLRLVADSMEQQAA